MSLYDDLDIDKEEKGGVAASWSSNYKLMKSQLQAKKASLIQSKSHRKSSTLAPVVDFKRTADTTDSPLKFNIQTGKLENVQVRERETRDTPVALGGSPFIASDPVPSLTGVKDEYNPLRPNDYEDIMKKKRDQKQKERDEDERKRDSRDNRDSRDFRDSRENRDREDRPPRRRDRDRDRDRDVGELERARRRREDDEDEYERPVRKKSDIGAAIAPPMSLLEEPPIKQEDNDSPISGMIPTGGLSVASKIMAKYGYKEGQGLGKSEQGMSTALFVEKTSKRGGKIIHERDLPKDTPRESVTNANLLRNPTKVILLRNMVGPGEVDEELEGETFEECGKYGKVIKCLIFEMPDNPDDEAVRIFVEFDRIDSAIKAIIDLNGRYFGGRVVKCCFFNLDKFRRLDLGADIDMPT
ncbi:splicing factor 45-like [Mercenaria mercenaria]|uniref:splicing factor 45-like n=1 Tax=Mercenaria mercenaria TaxID=6596 RepID=UPI00234E926C|nr:splicing factor 45-like [Mercenaria mercenaria]XP_045164807.2 splicing factor 45-like [Mercenaria mercenaria]